MSHLFSTRTRSGRRAISATIATLIIVTMAAVMVAVWSTKREDVGGEKVTLTLHWISEIPNYKGEIIGYDFVLDERATGMTGIGYRFKGDLTPMPEIGDELPFVRFHLLDGGERYRFLDKQWRRSYFGF